MAGGERLCEGVEFLIVFDNDGIAGMFFGSAISRSFCVGRAI